MEFLRKVYLAVVFLSGMFWIFVVRLLFFVGFLGSILVFALAIIMFATGKAEMKQFFEVGGFSAAAGIILTLLNKVFFDEV